MVYFECMKCVLFYFNLGEIPCGDKEDKYQLVLKKDNRQKDKKTKRQQILKVQYTYTGVTLCVAPSHPPGSARVRSFECLRFPAEGDEKTGLCHSHGGKVSSFSCVNI